MIKKGFSLIELLIVIAIMAILGSLALGAFSTARKQGRDTTRKADLAQYKVALEQYYTANGSYPTTGGGVHDSETTSGSIFTANGPLSSYLGGSPPRGLSIPTKKYYFISDVTNFVVQADLEVGTCWEICSNGRSGSLSAVCSSSASTTCHVP